MKRNKIMIILIAVMLAFPSVSAYAEPAVAAQEEKAFGTAQEQLEEFVERLYINFLSRKADDKGKASWINALHEGRCTGAKLVYGFIYSPEFQSNPLDNESYIEALYATIFNRKPDESGMNAWLSVLACGFTRGKVLEGFLNSIEMDNLCAAMGIRTGVWHSEDIIDRNARLTYFVSRFYLLGLGRNPDEAGLRTWVAGLAEKKVDGARVADSFFNGKEFRAKKISYSDLIQTIVRTMLGRDATEEDFEFFRKMMYVENYIGYTILSDGYAAFCKSYGVESLLEPYDWPHLEDMDIVMDMVVTNDNDTEETLPKLYRTLMYNGKEYSYRDTYSPGHAVIDESKIIGLVGDAEALAPYNGTGLENPDSEKTMSVQLFAIEGVSEDYVIAVRFAGDDNYYCYRNFFCEEDTFGGFLEDIGWVKYGSLKETAYMSGGRIITSYDKEWLIAQMESWKNAPKAETESIPYGEDMVMVSFGVIAPEISIESYGISITICETGHVQVSAYQGAVYFIGEETAASFIEELAAHVSGVSGDGSR